MDKINGYSIMSETCRKAVEKGRMSKEEADKKCRIYDFLATCDEKDKQYLFESSAFNDIAMSYVSKAVNELAKEGTIKDEQANAVRERFISLLSF